MAEPERGEPAAAAADEELPDVDVFEQAMDLARLTADATHSKHLIFGSSKWKVWCAAQLQNAGFNVDKPDKENAHGDAVDEDLFAAYQIVGQITIQDALNPDIDIDKIQFMPIEKILGLQIKLSPFHCWRLAIQTERKQHHHSTARPSRGTAAAAPRILRSQEAYEIAVPVATVLHTTLAVATQFSITILFEKDKNGQTLMTKEWPQVAARRVDVVYTNQHLSILQVTPASMPCSMFHVPLSATR